MLGRPEAMDDGNGILGQLVGSKDVSREVAHRASAPMLDSNRDGSMVDDVIGMIGKVMGGR